MESAAMVPRAVGGCAHLYFAVVAVVRFSQHLFFRLFIHSRSLAILGMPGNHHALREWHYFVGRTKGKLAGLAGACDYPGARRSTLRPDLAAKPDVHRHRNIVSDDYCA